MAYIFRSDVSRAEFDQFVQNSPLSNIMQESSWADVKREWDHLFCGVYENNELQACAMVLCRPLLFGFTLGYIPRGPIMDYDNEMMVSYMLQSLYQLGKTMKMVSIKFDPNIYQTFAIDNKDSARSARMDNTVGLLTKQSFCLHRGYLEDMYANTQPRHQLCFYQTEDIMYKFPKKTRDKVNSALAYHIEIEEHDVSEVEAFQKMISYTEKRKGIVLRSGEYFKNMMDAFDENATLLFAYLNHEKLITDLTSKKSSLLEEQRQLPDSAHKKQEILVKRIAKVEKELETAKQDMQVDGNRPLISALLLVKDKRTTELLYSGLNGHYRQYLAPYALRYRAIAWAFEHGCTRFNFGGVQGSLNDGLFEFKSAFHPDIDVYIGEFDIVIHKGLYHVIETLIPKLKQWKLNMAKRGKKDEN